MIFAQRRIFEIGEAALGRRQEQIPQADGTRERLELLNHLQYRPCSEPLGLLIKAALVRIDMFPHKLQNLHS